MVEKKTKPFSPMRWEEECLLLLDQTRLPLVETWLRCAGPVQVAEAIRCLAVRGAPAIGVAAAYGLALGVRSGGVALFDETLDLLLSTRPTAVNLRWALEQGEKLRDDTPAERLGDRLLEWAHELHAADVRTNQAIGRYGREEFVAGDRAMTHCNAGGLATAGYGTAVGVLQAAWEAQRLGHVLVDETRPLLQGARLTTWELKRLGIPHYLVADNSCGALMARGLVDRVVVGADRIAANGDAANKIGTYGVAVLAHYHGVPFFVAAPRSTIDPRTPSGSSIPIEERSPQEVVEVFGTRIAPEGTLALNYAFDVTPATLITGIITEVGVLRAPYGESIANALAQV